MIDRRRVRLFLVTFAVIGIPLCVLALAGARVTWRQLERQREAQVAQMAGVVAALVGDAQDSLRREAFVLARDPALVESASKGDWATLARWGAPRILALTRSGAADLLVVRDARGTPLVQVPPLVRVPPVAAPAPLEPQVSLALIDDRPYILATAALSTFPATDPPGPSPGTVVIGRRVEALGSALDKLPGRPGLVLVAGDRALGATRPDFVSGGWAAAARSGRIVVGGEGFALRALPALEPAGSPGALWALVAESETAGPVRRLWGWLIALSVGGAVIFALGVGTVVGVFGGRRTGRDAGVAAPPDVAPPDPGVVAEPVGEIVDVPGPEARALDELSVLHEMSRPFPGPLDPADVLERVRVQLGRILDVRHLIILLGDEAAERLDVAVSVADGIRRDSEPLDRTGLAAIVLRTGAAIRTDDYRGECARRGLAPMAEHADLSHWIGVPMAAGDRRLGVLAMASPDHAYGAGDARLLASVADLAALALHGARFQEDASRARAELAAAQDQLERTEKLRAMGQMASGMAHDFNNVLAAILGRAQLLLARIDEPALRQWLLVIERAASDGARTVRRLQDLTRLRREKPAEPVDLNRVIEETIEATEPSWRQESIRRGAAIEVETALAASRPVISGDPAELREALTNVILNAVDAMPAGGRLRVATRMVGRSIEVSISDTGTGIAESIRDRIFDPFFTTKGPKGTGLGLSMTYGILARYDGRITVESEEGAGTTFRIVFPATGSAPRAPVPVAPLARASTALRCLIVDDEPAVGAVLADMVAAIGHAATVVDSGVEALERLRAEPFDLVLTDLAMTGMTGWQLASAVKALVPGLPVFLVTGFGVEVAPAELARRGVDLVLAKPLDIEDMQAALGRVRPRAGEGS